MIEHIKRFIDAQAFSPTWVGVFVNPFYFARAGLDREIRRHAPRLTGELLDVGCGTKPYERYFQVDRYVGLEIGEPGAEGRESGDVDHYYDGETFPFADASFDAVVCNEVLEHVFNPDEFLSEVHRVLAPGGHLLLTVPFAWDEHEQPHDYARYSSFGLRHLVEKHGFTIEVQEKINADVTVIFQLFNAYLYKSILRLPAFLRFALTITLMALVNVTGVVARFLLPKNPDLFLDQLILARRAHES